jgi:hypothetical protein
MMQTTQDWEGEKLAPFVIWWNWHHVGFGNLLPDPLMRPGLVEVMDICVEYALELLLMQDEQVIETLTPHTAQKPFTDGIRSWSLIRCFENLDPTRLCNPSEARPKLAIVLPKKVFRPLSIRRGFPKLLCGPSKGTK